ncbi:MAG TPA: DUF2231 domain-containing protein [Armatimonadota bacterium]|jgi:uncharacterized membrane protein
MESRAKLAGHSVHQMLVAFPLGLLVTAAGFDLVGLAMPRGEWFPSAFYMIAVGVTAGVLAAVFGLIDWLAVPTGARAKMIGQWHGAGNAAVILLFAASWLLSRHDPAKPGMAAVVLAVLGAGAALASGWLGGELVARMGVGVDEGANLNAPSSLSGRPAGGVGKADQP